MTVRKKPGDVIGDDGRVRVLHPACLTCIGRRGDLIDLRPGRKEDVFDRNVQADALLTCHETLPGNDSGFDPAVCAVFWAVHRRDVLAGRLAHLIGITRIRPPEGPRP